MFNGDPGMVYMTRVPAKLTPRIYVPQAVVTLAADILPLAALAQVFDHCGAVFSGILRSRGKQVRVRSFQIFDTPVTKYTRRGSRC
jgi:Na+-driven multidrug efflux pump